MSIPTLVGEQWQDNPPVPEQWKGVRSSVLQSLYCFAYCAQCRAHCWMNVNSWPLNAIIPQPNPLGDILYISSTKYIVNILLHYNIYHCIYYVMLRADLVNNYPPRQNPVGDYAPHLINLQLP